MRKNLFTLLALIVVSASTFTGCKQEGCTDRDSVNYDPDADKNDGSCKYDGSVVFWYNQSTSNSLQSIQSTSLTYYLDGQIIGSGATSVYWTAAPECGQSGSVTATNDLGDDKSKSYSYKVVDQDGIIIWEDQVTLQANTCIQYQLN